MTFYKGHTQNQGKSNPRYVDGRHMYRDAIDRSKCAMCGAKRTDKRGSVDVHHRLGDRTKNEPEDLIALCRTCHNRREAVKIEGESGMIVVDNSEARFPLKVKVRWEK